MTEISLAAEPIMHVGSLVITNSIITSWIVVLLISCSAIIARKGLGLIPVGTISNGLDATIDYFIDTFEGVTGNRKKAIEFLPFICTFFLYILINNWFGLLPGVGTITYFNGEHVVPLFRGGNADLNATIALAIISVIGAQYYGIKHIGLKKHIGKYFNFKNPIMTSIGILELFSEISKMVSFSFRLFGNIFAGEVLLIVIAFLMPIIAPLPFFGLEIFVGLIQAIVFSMLTLVFLSIASSNHEEH